ncbi:MAG: hypothetical protein OXC05_12365 [Halieaceae bacterium]|nr:hypothetical protein [Halieaceae bacterium]
MKAKVILLIVFCSLLFGCATAYQKAAGKYTGGYRAVELEPGIYRVVFYGNGYTTKETVQTYWLYKCTEVALENGYDGFEILSVINLTQNFSVEEFFHGKNPLREAQVYYFPMDVGPKPELELEGDIRLLRNPVSEMPPKIFDARKLQEALSLYVNAEEKCEGGNICEHVHKYLHPEGTFDVDA